MKDTADKKTIDMLKAEPKTNAERQKAYRAKQKNRLDVYISDDASERLNTLSLQGNTTKKEVLEGLICGADIKQMNDVSDDFFSKLAKTNAFKDKSQDVGELALVRLVEVAQQDNGQALIVRQFLLGCYDGSNTFDLTGFRVLDLSIFQDCMAVLAMDWGCKREIHEYVPNGGKLFQSWVKGAK